MFFENNLQGAALDLNITKRIDKKKNYIDKLGDLAEEGALAVVVSDM